MFTLLKQTDNASVVSTEHHDRGFQFLVLRTLRLGALKGGGIGFLTGVVPC
jgi:hypothetical protein